MSDFTAKFQAILDTSKIPSQIAALEKTPLKLSKITLDTKNLPSQIQASLDGHNFTIKLDGIKMENINSQATKAGQSYSQAFADGVRTQLSNGGIEASIARVTAQYEKLATSGHGYLSKITTDIQRLNDLHNDLATNTGDNKALVNTYKQFSEVLTNVRNNLITVSAQTKSIASQSQIDSLSNKMSTWMLNNTKASGQFGTSIQNLRNRLAALGANVPISELNKLEQEFKQIKEQASAAGLAGNSFATSIKNSFKNISSYISIATVLRQSVEVLKEMAQNVLAVDTAMTGLYRVTNLTNAQYRKLYSDMAKSAKDYGAELTTIIDATTNWTKLGFEVNIARRLSEITTMYQQVADLDTKTAVDNLVTAYKGFEEQLLALTGGDTVAAVELVADIFNKLGNEFAVEASDIGAALNNSASALEMAGNTIQQTAAMATGIIEITQDASRAGNALRTLTLRLRGTSAKDIQALGEDVDGLVEVTSKLQATIKKQTGVDLVDANGQLRSTFEIMRDLANVWETLDANTQANVLETIAGKNRASDVAALLNNWEQVEAALESATGAAGTAREEYDQFLNSLQAHLNRLETAWQKLSYSFMDVGLLKGGVDVLVGALEALDALVNSLGSAGTVGAGFALFALFKNISGIKTFISALNAARIGTISFSGALNYAKVSLTAFLKTPMGVATAIGLITAAVSAAVQWYKNLRAEQEAVRKQTIETSNDFLDSVDSFEKAYIRYSGQMDLTEEEELELRSAIDGTADALTNKNSSLLTVIGTQEDYLRNLQDIAKAEIEAARTEAKAAKDSAKDQLYADAWDGRTGSQITVDLSGRTAIEEFVAAKKILEEHMPEYLDMGTYGWELEPINFDKTHKDENAIVDYYYKLLEMRDLMINSDLMDNDVYDDIVEIIDHLSDSVADYVEQVYNVEKYNYMLANGIPTTVEEYTAMCDTIIATTDATGNFLLAIQQLANQEYGSIFGNIFNVPEVNGDSPSAATQYLTFPELLLDTDSESDYIDQINAYRDKIEYLQDMLDKVREGAITPEDQLDLIALYPELASEDNLDDGIISIIQRLKGASKTADKEAYGIVAIFDEMYKEIDPNDADSIKQFNQFRSIFLSLFDTAEQGVPVFKNLADAISGVGDASDLITKVQEEIAETGSISLGALESLAKEFGSDIGSYISVDESGNITADIDKIKNYYISAIEAMAIEDENLKQSLIDALNGGFDSVDHNFQALSDAMEQAQEIASVAADAQEKISYDTVESLRNIFGQNFENYILKDEVGNYVGVNIEALRTYARSLLETSGASDAALASFDTMWQSTMDGSEKAATALDRVSDALDNVNAVSGYLTMLESDDLSFVDALEKAVKLLEVMGDGYSLDNFFTFGEDGSITYNSAFLTEWLNAYIDDMVTAGDISEDFATQMKAAAQAETEQVDALEGLTTAMADVSKAASLLTTANREIAEDGRNSLDTIMSLYDQFGEKAAEMLTTTADGAVIIDVDKVKEELLKTIEALEDVSPEIKQIMRDALNVSIDEDPLEDQVNDSISKVRKLQDVLDSLRNGTITAEERVEIALEYPELLEAPNLEIGLSSLIAAEKDEVTKLLNQMYAAIDPSDEVALAAFAQWKQVILSLYDTAETATPVFESMTDAMTGIGDAADLISRMQEEIAKEGSLSLDTVQALFEEFGSGASKYLTFGDDGVITADIAAIKQYYIDALNDMEFESADLKQALIDALNVEFDEGKLKFDGLTDAMSEAEKLASIVANAADGMDYDVLSALRDAFGEDFEKYIVKDSSGNYSDVAADAIREYARSSLILRGATEADIAAFDLMWESVISGSTKAKTAIEKLSDGLSNVSKVSDYLTFLESDDLSFIDALEKANKLLEVMGDGYSLDDFFKFGEDGDITYHTEFLTTWIDEYIDGMVEAGDVSEDVAAQMKAAAKAEMEQTNAIEQLTDAMSKVEKASDLIATAQEEIEKSGSNSIKTLISLYEQFGEKANDMYSISADGGFIIDTDLVKQEMYALIDEIEAASPEIKQAMKDALDVQLEEEAFEDTVDEYVSKIQTLQDALETLRSDGKLSDSALYDLVKEFPELATETDNLEAAITNLIGSMNTDIVAEFEKQFGKIDSEEDREQLQAFMDIVLKLGEVVGNTQFAIDINAEVDGMQNLFTAMKESVSSTGLTAESIANLKKRYQDLESYDPARLFERTENGIHLNTKALRELESEYEKLTKESIDNTLDDLVKQYNDLTKQIDAAGTSASTVELYAQRNDILKQIEETAELAAQYAGLTSAFYAWEQAQSLGEEGDMYDSLTGGLKDIKQLYQDGLIGTNKFRTAVQLMSNEDLSNATTAELLAAYEAGYPKMQRYFQDSSDGVLNFLHDVEDLNSEWVHMNEDGSWDINFGVGNDQEIADALGINVESVQAILRKLSDYGFDINLDSMYSDLETMQSKAEKAAAKLKELGATDVDFDFDVTNLARLDEQIEDAEEALKKFTNADGTINLEMEGAAEAQYVLATLILQRQALEDPLIFKVDANNIEGVVGETLRKLQTIKQQYNNLDLQASIGADTSGIESDINATISSFTDEEKQILAKLNIDPTASVEEINTAISRITPELLMTVGIDETALTTFTETDHDTTATVVYNVDGSKVNSYTPRTKYASVKYTASMYDWTPPTKYGTVYYTAKTTKPSGTTTTPTKNNNFTPVAVARGTAYAGGTSGNWGAKNSGTALGGELGEELVVRDGKYFTIGSDGAEFFKYKKNDIIFNHKQTEELFKNGKLSGADGRGKAFAEGTAFSSGSGTITGGGNVITNPSGGNGNGGSGGDGEEEKESKIIDWIEIAIDRIERAIGKLGRIAQSAYKSLATRLRASDDEIKKVIEEINKQNQGYNRYMQQAESVNLSADLKEKVRNGTIDITEYDGDTAELIEEYQKWYEKALDCADAIDELHETLASLYEEKFNNIAADFDNQLTLIEHRAEMFNSSLDEIEARGHLGGSELYNELIATENTKVNKLNAKLAELTKAMSDAVNSGEVEVGSEAWYAMQAAINETKLAIQESEVAMLEYNNAIRDMEWQHFDYLQERISQITKEADFLINLMSDTDLYTDQGQLSDTGMATMGLHGVNYNTYLAQAEQYADEIKKLDEELAKAPYNKDLIARREELLALQQDSITSAEAEKQAIIDMVQEGINLELSSLKELIDAYTDSLDSAKDLYDYQKKIKKQTAEVASLQKQLAAYQNDTSEENRARLQKLEVDLSDAMEDLEETQYDRYIKEQKRLLDDFYDDYEENLNQRLDDVDALISDMIDMVNANSDDIADTIVSECADVGYTMSSSMNSIWLSGGAANNVITTYGNAFSDQLTTLNSVISGIATNVAAMVAAGDDAAEDETRGVTTTTDTVPTDPPRSDVTSPTTPPPITNPPTQTNPTPPTDSIEQTKKKQVKITSGTWHIRTGASTKYDIVGYAHKGDVFDFIESSGNWNAVTYKGKKRWINNGGSKIIEGYSKGGYIAELQKIAMQNGDDMFTVNTLKKGEAVLSTGQTAMFRDFIDELPVAHDVLNMSRHITGITSAPSQLSQPISNDNNYEVNIEIDHVEDYDDLVYKMQRDHKFEKMIQAMTVDQLVGGSKLAKHKIRV